MKEIYNEGKQKMKEVRDRGVYLAEGYNGERWKLNSDLDQEIQALYADAKKAIWTELTPLFINTVPGALQLKTRSHDRTDYILHPQTGEVLDDESFQVLKSLSIKRKKTTQVQIIVSDGLNANAIMDDGHLSPYLSSLTEDLNKNQLTPASEIIVIRSGRVRAGYRIGEILFGEISEYQEHRGIIHIIGERPGTIHHTFSAYITAPTCSIWKKGSIDHNITRVVSGIANTALAPGIAAEETVKILMDLWISKTI